ncbi:MAG TPA: DUF2249 domain-containing protein [Thermomicrobiales bacterium]|nr:DUF2249 domain-containing protein [Thermomicrobiales bacterium]
MVDQVKTQTNRRNQPIELDWRIHRVLECYPALHEVIIQASPAFRRLRNPVVRRVQSRLVTVKQAAEIAGIDPDTFLASLNEAAGVDQPLAAATVQETQAESVAAPPWVDTAVVAQRVDVRPLQKAGEEPFSVIMAASREVDLGQVLALRNTFEPTPLYDVLGARGFEHWARELGPQDWEILFFHSGVTSRGETRAEPRPPAQPVESGDWNSPTATVTIDVSELVPPEPMIKILTALEELPAGGSLLVHHVRRPMHLYPRLDELGYRHETRDIAPNRVEVLIEKPAEGEE